MSRPDIKDFTQPGPNGGQVTDYSGYKIAVVNSIDVSTLETRKLPISGRLVPARLGVSRSSASARSTAAAMSTCWQ